MVFNMKIMKIVNYTKNGIIYSLAIVMLLLFSFILYTAYYNPGNLMEAFSCPEIDSDAVDTLVIQLSIMEPKDRMDNLRWYFYTFVDYNYEPLSPGHLNTDLLLKQNGNCMDKANAYCYLLVRTGLSCKEKYVDGAEHVISEVNWNGTIYYQDATFNKAFTNEIEMQNYYVN